MFYLVGQIIGIAVIFVACSIFIRRWIPGSHGKPAANKCASCNGCHPLTLKLSDSIEPQACCDESGKGEKNGSFAGY